MTPQARRDFSFACRCCSAGLGIPVDSDARDLHAAEATPAAIRCVLRERVGALACKGLSARGILARLPRRAITALQVAYASNAALNEVRRIAVRNIAAELANRRMPYRLLRGAALAARCYGDLGLRPCADQDILVPPARWDEAAAAIRDCGYRQDAEYPGVFRKGKVLIDLHASLGNLGRIGARRHVYARLEALAWRDPGVDPEGLHMLPPAVDLIHLACHALKHAYGHLIWTADMAAWINTFGMHGLTEAAAVARSTGLTWPLLWGLRMVRRCLGMPIPSCVGRRDVLCGGSAANRVLERLARGHRPAWAGPLLVALSAGSLPRVLAVLRETAFPRREVMKQVYPNRSALGACAARAVDIARSAITVPEA